MLAFCLIAQLNRKFVQNNKTEQNCQKLSQTYYYHAELLPCIEMIYIIEEINEKTLKNMFQSQ